LSASDAYVRDYSLYVPADCVAGQSEQDHRSSLELMKKNFRAKTAPGSEIRLAELLPEGPHSSAA
jgi:isochorismate hydrolase